MAHILVVDDKEMMRDSLQAILVRADHEVVVCESGIKALEEINRFSYDVIVSDLKMPGMDGLKLIEELKKTGSEIPFIMMTAFASIPTAVEAMRKGAYDYIQKPFDADEILLLIARALEHSQLKNENDAYREGAQEWQRTKRLIGKSSVMQQVTAKTKLIAPSSVTVLIRGESGTGKEMISRAIHAQSPRANKPMLCVNCAALSNTLLESELFGHEKGAFTGAERIRKGRFELANGGTLLLDEISEMDLKLQAKLLRVLQEREYERVGSSITRKVDVRVIATTNRNLEKWVFEGKFREDLFYRLNVVPIEVPPLRDRVDDDLELLCEHFLQCIAEREGTERRALSPESITMLKHYHWPGNVRELENLMERISILSTSEVVTPDMIEGWLACINQSQEDTITSEDLFDGKSIEEMEQELIEKTLVRFSGHRKKTAQSLGIGLRTLGMKIKRWELEKVSS